MAHDQKPADLDKGLEEIRREVIESRNLVIKTDNLLKNLHAELKLVGKRQEDFQKRQWISSGVAYAGFAVLCISGAIVISTVRTSASTSERERLEKQVLELNAQTEKTKADVNANAQAQRAAGEVYRLMTALPGDERLKGIDALVKLEQTRLSPLEKQALADRAEGLRKEVGQSAFERGKQAFHRNDFKGSVEDLTRFLAMNPSPEEASEAAYFLGASLTQVRKPDLAIPQLSRFISENKRSKTRDYAMLLLAQSYDQTSQFEKAAETAREAIGTYPNSEFLSQFKNRLSAAKRGLSAAAEPSAAAPVPGPAPAPPPAAPKPAPAAKPATPAPAR